MTRWSQVDDETALEAGLQPDAAARVAQPAHGLAAVSRSIFVQIFGIAFGFGIALYFFASRAHAFWPWPLADPRSAAVLGAGFLGGALYFALALRANSWEASKNSIGGMFLWSTVLLVLTAIHWEVFRPYSIATLIWLPFYYVGLLGMPILYRLEASREGGRAVGGVRVRGFWRAWMATRGVIYLLLAVVLIVFADALVAPWPWRVNAVDLRAFTAQTVACGWNGTMVLRDDRWVGHRFALLQFAFAGVLQLVALFALSTPYDWSRPLGILVPVLFVEWIVTGAALLAAHRER